MGFHEIEFEAKFKTVFASGIDVRKSYKMIDLSVAAEASIEVSV
jgi:hypothetical protein